MFRWKKTITDDAGAQVYPHDLSSPTDEPARDADSLAALNALLMQEVYVSTRGNLAGPQLMYITAGLTGLVVLVLVRSFFPASPAFMSYIGAGVGAGVQVVVGLRWHAARAAATIVATMLAHGRCGSCGYSLREIVPGDHGRAVCPECGAEWNHARLGSARVGTGGVLSGKNATRSYHSPPGALLDPPTFVDDGQRVVRLMDSTTIGEMDEPTHAGVWAAAKKKVRRDRALSLVLLAIFLPVTAALLFYDFMRRLPGPHTVLSGVRLLGVFVGIWAVLFFGIVYFIKGLRAHYERYAPAIRDAFVAHGRCPACSAALPEAPPVEHASDQPSVPSSPRPTECPGCGARWNRP